MSFFFLQFLFTMGPLRSMKNSSHEKMLLIEVPSFDGRSMLFISLWHNCKVRIVKTDFFMCTASYRNLWCWSSLLQVIFMCFQQALHVLQKAQTIIKMLFNWKNRRTVFKSSKVSIFLSKKNYYAKSSICNFSVKKIFLCKIRQL